MATPTNAANTPTPVIAAAPEPKSIPLGEAWLDALRRDPERIALGVVSAIAVIFIILFFTLRGGGSTSAVTAPQVVTSDATTFWSIKDRKHERAQTAADAPQGARGLTLDLHAGRSNYTFLEHRFPKAVNWSHRPYFLLDEQGTGGGGTIQLVVDFAPNNTRFVVYNLTDTTPNWRQVAFSPLAYVGKKGTPNWAHVIGLRLVAKKNAIARISLGTLAVAPRTDYGK